jgi:hypothetical protein
MTWNQDHVVGDGAMPDAGRLTRLGNPPSSDSVEFAVFLQRELVAPHGLELGRPSKSWLAGT